ncbi:MAG: hypothetical protein BYD32DRAFT_55339 [Podila humilis]|nr:MAG: hypothetical protein BYD32DRAFT_55339 [Podila humilis]
MDGSKCLEVWIYICGCGWVWINKLSSPTKPCLVILDIILAPAYNDSIILYVIIDTNKHSSVDMENERRKNRQGKNRVGDIYTYTQEQANEGRKITRKRNVEEIL